MERSGRVTASVSLRVTTRDLDALDGLNGVLAIDYEPDLNVHGVTWHVSWTTRPGRRSAPPRSAPPSARRPPGLRRRAGCHRASRRAHRRRRPARRRHRVPPHGPQHGVHGQRRRRPARDPGADSCSAGAHRDHRGSLPHHRRVPARALKAIPGGPARAHRGGPPPAPATAASGRQSAAGRAASSSCPSEASGPGEHRAAPRDRPTAGTGAAGSTTAAGPVPPATRPRICSW